MAQVEQSGLGNTRTKPCKARSWSMTLNNFNEEEKEELKRFFQTSTGCKWVIGDEVGENGTPHLQIYFRVKNAISFNTLKKLNNRLHIEKSHGTLAQNFCYCIKDSKYESNICIEDTWNKIGPLGYKWPDVSGKGNKSLEETLAGKWREFLSL